MKTQISRDTHRPAKRYSGVYQQQGRMITDSDWNELVEILRRRLGEALRDVVDDGAPRERAVELVDAPADADGHEFRIQPGWVYADGVAAQVVADPDEDVVGNFRFAQQADFPGASAPADTAGVFYADVWERPVVSLEDPDPADSDDPENDPRLLDRALFLRDPALHGADTTTRTQTMAQIKWAPEGVDLTDAEQNPQRGDAPLDVTLRAQTEEADECDPCADEVAISTRTGNYLFRLEVHDLEGDPKNPSEITLKWSSENGAEQHRVGSETPEFKTGAWVYELYDGTSEKHLGVHLATGFTPTRGELVEKAAGDPYPTIDPEVWPWVRRWDGYCVLSRDGATWSLKKEDQKVKGRDRTTALSETGESSAQGHVSFPDGGVTLNLQTLTLSLGLTDRTFVAGDFWLAVVREVIHDTGDTVLSEAPPLGIVHHYLRLRRVDATGALVPLTTEEQRRLNFPPLTDIRAGDVGYDTGCDPEAATPLFDASHDTVQKALDQICQLAAENIGYTTDCEPDAAEPLFGPDQDTVKKALDQICQMAAQNIGYTTDCEPDTAEPLFGPDQDTVKKALDQICQIAAQNIGYAPDCGPAAADPLFDPSVHDTVKKALDQICQMAAQNIGYDGSCDSGLFDGTQDTVKKALDRLCELAAEHVAYGGSCDSGLFDGGQATLREALDRLCELAAEHVAYGGSCESGLFDGNQATVKDALDRLCQIAAAHVAFTPHAECEDLQEATTVQEALDALCLRPTGGSVSRDVVQPGHGFRPGDAIYFDADANRYLKALANRPTTTGLFLVSEVESDEELTLLQAGYLDLAAVYPPGEIPGELRLQPGHYYFVSTEEPGGLTPDEPTSGISNPILYADSETGGYVLPWRPSEPVSGGQSAQEYIDQLFVGTVNAFAMEEPPEGWLECNGQAIGRREFARLFERIGTRFGEGNGATTFNVPDLRGEFLRGWDHGRGVDSRRELGSFQVDALQIHRHNVPHHSHKYWDVFHSEHLSHKPASISGTSLPGGIGSHGGTDADNVGFQFQRDTESTSVDTSLPLDFDSRNPVRIFMETRPRNISLMYCIKF